MRALQCRLTTGIRSEKYVVRRFRRFASVIERTYTNLDSIACYTLSLLLLGYSNTLYIPVQRVTVLNAVGSFNTVVSITILYYNIIILWDHRPICGPSLTETSLCGGYRYCLFGMYRSSVQNDYRTAISIKADSHIACRAHTVPMPFPCHAVPLRV